MKKTILLILSTFLFFSSGNPDKGRQALKNTEATGSWGTLTFSVTTLTNNGPYSPKHVLAIWIRDANGDFVKTRKLRGNNRKGYLYTWVGNTNQNVTDATTGATLSSHTTHTITWDCTDLSGALVPDGDYKVAVEFTDVHAQGPYAEFVFTKGSAPVHLTPANMTNFTNIDLQYTPSPAGINDVKEAGKVRLFPNPVSTDLYVDAGTDIDLSSELFIFDQAGRIVASQGLAGTGSSGVIHIGPSVLGELPAGIYFLSVPLADHTRSVERFIHLP